MPESVQILFCEIITILILQAGWKFPSTGSEKPNHLRIVPSKNFKNTLHVMIFTESALWADSVYKLRCPSVCLFVSLCVALFVRHTLETTLPEGLETSGRREYR